MTYFKDYEMKLKASKIEKLEKKYNNRNLAVLMFGGAIPPLSLMLDVAYESITQQGVSRSTFVDAYDDWIEEGHDMMEFYEQVINPLMQEAGFFKTTNPAEA